MKKPDKPVGPELLANHQIVVIAAYLAGAKSSSADTEDIAVHANAIAPGRFTWRRYKDQINIETVRKRLWDATKPDNGAYLIGSERTGWRLTKAGFDFARKHARKGLNEASKTRASQPERVAQQRELRRMAQEQAFLKYQAGEASAITKGDAERFFRIDDYVTGKARLAKIERFKIIASARKELLAAVDYLATIVREVRS